MGVFAFIYLPLVVVIVYSFHDSPDHRLAAQARHGPLVWRTGARSGDARCRACQREARHSGRGHRPAGRACPAPSCSTGSIFPGRRHFAGSCCCRSSFPGSSPASPCSRSSASWASASRAASHSCPGWPVVLGHAAALTSVVITQVFARLQRLDRAQEEASQDLYANELADIPLRHLPQYPNRRARRGSPGVHAEPGRNRRHLLPDRAAEYAAAPHLGVAEAGHHTRRSTRSRRSSFSSRSWSSWCGPGSFARSRQRNSAVYKYSLPPTLPPGKTPPLNRLSSCMKSGSWVGLPLAGDPGGWTGGGGQRLGWLYAPRTRDRRVCILRPSGGSTLAADFLLELRAPISGGGEGAPSLRTECRANNEKRSL